jgi:hypothetical protein
LRIENGELSTKIWEKWKSKIKRMRV